jgi:hypothetical protein
MLLPIVLVLQRVLACLFGSGPSVVARLFGCNSLGFSLGCDAGDREKADNKRGEDDQND